ncbi:hypothetical protein E4U44_005497 [Claviceps purpurea]|nr:hypothetical protein E4U44_005497 [Claviceps purpurea]
MVSANGESLRISLMTKLVGFLLDKLYRLLLIGGAVAADRVDVTDPDFFDDVHHPPSHFPNSSPPPSGKLENAALSTTTSSDVDADVDGTCSSTVLLVRGRK